MQINSKNTSFIKCNEIDIPDKFYNRIVSGRDEIDHMFGTPYIPGFMPGSAITITGTPGAGKTTLILQVLNMLSNTGHSVAYASGEESDMQLAYSCRRLGVNNIDIANINDVDMICEAMDNYDVMVVDSFQALRSKNVDFGKKQFQQHAQDLLINKAKDSDCVLIFVLHITTSGLSKGGTDIIHAVDVNVRITREGDGDDRIIEVYKNRFGETKSHLALMTSKGFDFQGVYTPSEEKSNKSQGPKESVVDSRKNKILEMKEPPHITQERVMEILGVKKHTAYNLLLELTKEGKLKRFGRGVEACWKIVDILNELKK